MGKTAFLFPGQGAQFVGMGADLCEAFPAAAETFNQANDILGFDLKQICFTGPEEELTKTSVSQPAILVMSIAALRAMESAARDRAPTCEAAAGLSLGEYTALVAAGALQFEDAVRLVERRGAFMHEASVQNPGAMASIIGLDDDAARAVCEEAAKNGIVSAVNFNCPGQVAISGEPDAVKAASELALARGAKMAVPLKVEGAFHSALMQPARERLAAEIEKVEFRKARVPVAANVSGEYVVEPDDIRVSLVEQLTRPVLWSGSMARLISDGVEQFYEIGPGKVLSGLLRRIDRSKKVVVVGTAKAVNELAS
ncbi:MAG: ACP S-malonyltransferase [Planctomycetota bacterium]